MPNHSDKISKPDKLFFKKEESEVEVMLRGPELWMSHHCTYPPFLVMRAFGGDLEQLVQMIRAFGGGQESLGAGDKNT